MKSAKWWIGLWAVLGMVAGFPLLSANGATQTETETVDGVKWHYTVEGGKATVTWASPVEGWLTVPSSLDGYPVTSIGRQAFDYCTNLWSVILPDGVTNIGESAFYWCTNLTSVTIPDSVRRIGTNAFYRCQGLTGVTIPGNVTSIENGAFSGCSGLTRVKIPESVTNIGGYAFGSCDRLTSVTIGKGVVNIGAGAFSECPASLYDTTSIRGVQLVDGWVVGTTDSPPSDLDLSGIRGIAGGVFGYYDNLTSVRIPDGAVGIGEGTFQSCTMLASVTIPDSVTSIGKEAFRYCGLTSVRIGKGVTCIGTGAFVGCSELTEFHVAAGNPSYVAGDGVLFTKNRQTLVCCPGGKKDCYAIPDGVTHIGDEAFSCCEKLTSVRMPDSVTSIGKGAFSYCYRLLTSMTIGNNVTNIGDDAFFQCNYLASVTIPDSVKRIGKGAFTVCSASLYDTTSIPGVKLVDGWVVGATTIPVSHLDLSGVRGIADEGDSPFGGGIFCWCPNLQSVTIPDNITTIPAATFSWCSELKLVSIGKGVKSIGAYAFEQCTNLTAVYISDLAAWCNIDFCDDYWKPNLMNSANPLYYARHLYLNGREVSGNLVIPSGATRIGNGAFYNRTNLTSVTIPDNVKTIGVSAFSGCKSMKSVSIGKGVKSIGEDAFSQCTNLTAVCISDLAAWCGIDFDNEDLWETNPLLRTERLYLNGKELSGNLVIPKGVKSIGHGAFYYCTNLTSVTIPNSVTSIGERAFDRCTDLTSVTIGSSVTNIGKQAFQRCYDLESITIPDSVTTIGKSAFSWCYALKSVSLPDRVTRIENSVFFCCEKLKSLAIPDSVTHVGKSAFYNCHGLEKLYVPSTWKWTDMLAQAEVPSGCQVVYVTFHLSADSRTFTADAASGKELGVTANVGWKAASSVSWLTVKTTSGSGNGTVVYDVAENTGTGSRTGKIKVTGSGGMTRTFTVTQSGKVAASLSLASSGQTFTAAGAGNQSLGITANVAWTAKSSASWLTVKTASGSGNGTIAYNVAANTGTGSRTATITVSGGGLTRTFTVTQGGVAAAITLGADSRTFTPDAAKNKELEVMANVKWTVSSSVPWLELKTEGGSGNGTIVYDVAANTGETRTGILTVSGGGLTRVFTVTQNGYEAVLELASGERTFTADAAKNKELEVTANVKWTVTSSVSWLALKTEGGSGNGTIVYDVAANTGATRTGTITVSGGGLTRVFTVTQNGYEAVLELASGERTFTADAAKNKELEVTANVKWTVTSSVSWLALKTEGGSGNGTIVYDVAANTGATRTGSITVSGGGLTRVFTVTQNGYEAVLELASSERTFTAAAAKNKELEVTASMKWTVTSSVSWLALKTEGGSGNGTIVYDVATNTGATRTGSITVSGGGLTRVFTVTQEGKSGEEETPTGKIAWRYTVANGEATVTSGEPGVPAIPTTTTGAISVPSRLGGYPVRGIGAYAFCGCAGLKSVAIPDGVTEIGEYAFEICTNLTSVVIPESVTSIGDFAFDQSGLTSVTIPDSVTHIGFGAFYNCGPLASVTIGNRVESIGGSAFCIGTPGAVMLPPSVTEMEEGVFYMSSVGKLYLPASWEGTELEGYLWSRSERVYYNPETLSLASNSRLFTAAAASGKELEVTGKVAWTAKSGTSWLTVTRGSGTGNGTIVYDVAENTGTGARTGTITVTGGEVPWTFTVVQRGFRTTLELGATERTFTAAAANDKELEVTSSVKWTVTSSVSWLALKTEGGSGNGTIVYDVAANTGATRTGTITVSGGGLTRTFTVTQSGKTVTLALGAPERTFTADAANGKLLEVTANVSWTAKSSASWLTVKTASGSGNGNIEYAVAANTGAARTGTITVAGGGLTRTFTVTQQGVKTETQESPVGIPYAWLEENAAAILASNGGDYEAAAMAKAANGKSVWECYVAGLSTTDKGAEFKVKSISFVDGEPVVEWEPDLNEGGTPNVRTYTVQGKPALTDDWGPCDPSSRFFRVQVELP